MITTKIVSGNSKRTALTIGSEGEARVAVHPHPPKDEYIAAIPFRQRFASSSGATDMRVVGTLSSPIDFYVTAETTYDTYVKTCSIAIVDAGMTLNKFGNITALTNGIQIIWETQDRGTVTIAPEIQTNFAFMRIALGNPAFGSGASSFIASNVLSTSEGIMPTIDFALTFGLAYGLRLRKGTKDKVIFRVRDDVTALDQFDVVGYGLKI